MEYEKGYRLFQREVYGARGDKENQRSLVGIPRSLVFELYLQIHDGQKSKDEILRCARDLRRGFEGVV
jgi:propanediol dehydratase small subunit